MINEQLVATVQYKGQSVGTAELIIQDTSFYPTYNFKMVELSSGNEIAFNQLQQLCNYRLTFSQVDIAPDLDNIYVVVKSSDGKFLSQADETYGASKEVTLTLPIAPDGTGYLSLETDFFPSFTGYSAEIYFYHDAEHLYLVRSIPISVIAITAGSLEVIPNRNAGRGTLSYYPLYVEMGEDLLVSTNVQGPSVLTGTTPTRFKGKVNTSDFTSNIWMPVGPDTELNIGKVNNNPTNPAIGSLKFGTIFNPAVKNEQAITVNLGELAAINALRYPSYADGIAWKHADAQLIDLYRRKSSLTNVQKVVGILQGQSNGTNSQARMGPVTISNQYFMFSAVVGCHAPVLGANNPELYAKYYFGPVAGVTIDPTRLTTLESRAQYGKFQKAFNRTVDNTVPASMTVTWNDISDPIADAAYGVPASLIGSDIVVLTQCHGRADINNLLFNTGGVKEFYIRPVAYTETGANLPYNDIVSVLVLRKSEMLDTYPSWIGYPRVIKADWASGQILEGEGAWVITIPEGTSIDLTEDRYFIQHNVEQTEQNGGNITYSWENCRVRKEKSKITIFGSFTNASPDPKHYAIWDLGPETSLGVVTDGRLRGDVKPLNVSQWMTGDISTPPNPANSFTLLAMTTVGEAAQVYQSSDVNRNVVGFEKHMDITLRDTFDQPFTGQAGVLVWDWTEIVYLDRRIQFGKYQYSYKYNLTAVGGPAQIALTDVNNPIASSEFGALTSLKDPTLMVFINPEKFCNNKSIYWSTNSIEAKANSNIEAWAGALDVLMIRTAGWITHAEGTDYPRIVYAQNHNVGSGYTLTLPIDKSVMSDPTDKRYQLLAQARPNDQTDGWFDCNLVWLSRGVDDWTINLEASNPRTMLQVAIIDYGPGAMFWGKGTTIETVVSTQITNMLPSDRLSTDSLISLMPTKGISIGSGGSGYQQGSVTNRGINRVPNTNIVEPYFQGQWLDITWGGSCTAARGAIAWERDKRIGVAMKTQIPNIVARSFSNANVRPGGIVWDDLTADLTDTNYVGTNFGESNLVVIPFVEEGGNAFKYELSTDKKTLTYRNSDNNSLFPMTGKNQVNTLILKELLTKPNFDADTPYPRVIYAKKIVATDYYSTPMFAFDLNDPSYDGVDISTGRYQIVQAMHSTNGARGLNGYSNVSSGARNFVATLLTNATYTSSYGFGCIMHVAVIDLGPNFNT